MNRAVNLALVICGAGVMVSSPLSAAESKNNQAEEYQQARKIALKDPHVQDAYKRAEERLNERILEIDPSLKPYVDKHSAQPAAAPAKPAAAAKTTKVAATPAPKHTAVAHKPTTTGNTHVVAKGETLSSIALDHKVSVASLKTANNITDEKKLRVGQKLVIPASSKPASSAAPAKKEQGFWDKVKETF